MMKNRYILFTSIVSALGGLLFGYDTAVISGAIPYLQSYFRLDAASLGWGVSCILIGCSLGAITAGKMADRYGRRSVLFVCSLLFALSGLGVGWSSHFWLFVIFRIMGGLGVGAAAVVCPMYIAETAPAQKRGSMVALYQMAIVSGILLAYSTDYLLGDDWRLMFISQVIPASLFLVLLCFVAETPRWLVSKGRDNQAMLALAKLGVADPSYEIRLIQETFNDHRPVRFGELFKRPYAKVMLIGIAVAVFQQISGINAILYYAPVIFNQTGLGHNDALLQTILIGIVNVLATFVAIFYVDKVGRKRFLQAGGLLMGLCLLTIALCFHLQYFSGDIDILLTATLVYVATFACTLGAVTWVYLSEIFPNRIRGLALSVATLALWLADFAVSYIFPVMTAKLGTSVTLISYALCCGIAFLVFSYLPETKGQSLEEITNLFTETNN